MHIEVANETQGRTPVGSVSPRNVNANRLPLTVASADASTVACSETVIDTVRSGTGGGATSAGGGSTLAPALAAAGLDMASRCSLRVAARGECDGGVHHLQSKSVDQAAGERNETALRKTVGLPVAPHRSQFSN